MLSSVETGFVQVELLDSKVHVIYLVTKQTKAFQCHNRKKQNETKQNKTTTTTTTKTKKAVLTSISGGIGFLGKEDILPAACNLDESVKYLYNNYSLRLV